LTVTSRPCLTSLVADALAQASTTRHVAVAPGGLTAVAPWLAREHPGTPVAIVADERTWEIAGSHLSALLERDGILQIDEIILPGSPTLRPDTTWVATIADHARRYGGGLPIAVGAGSINDLTKRAAHELGLPYIAVATAASMDGYTASGAALLHNGVKQTFACAAPVAVFADLDILAAAPPAMTASGYGDLLGKVTAGADWIIADALGIEPIDPRAWAMVQGPLPDLIADPARYVSGDPAAIESLFLGLVLTGLAIQATGSSRCASGSEHQFSHLWEMRGLEHNGELVSHGMKVGFGTLFATALYERLLARDWSKVDVERALEAAADSQDIEDAIRAMTDPPAMIDLALRETAAKHTAPDALAARLQRLQDVWPDLRDRLKAQLVPVTSLRASLIEAGCPVTPDGLGLTTAQVLGSYREARLIRRRYTVYDLADDLGVLDELVAEIGSSRLFRPG
jgi:glycerol-1-phosphate dehydrogenase [NAD(P)+]